MQYTIRHFFPFLISPHAFELRANRPNYNRKQTVPELTQNNINEVTWTTLLASISEVGMRNAALLLSELMVRKDGRHSQFNFLGIDISQ